MRRGVEKFESLIDHERERKSLYYYDNASKMK